jgi:hypothetical protein
VSELIDNARKLSVQITEAMQRQIASQLRREIVEIETDIRSHREAEQEKRDKSSVLMWL